MIGACARRVLGALLVLAALPCFAASALDKPLTFRQAVGVALSDSPLMRKGQLELGLRQLDEADSRSAFLPSVYLDAGYVFNPPEDSDSPFYLSFNTGNYNILDPYFSLKARKLVTRIAELTVLQGVSDGLQRLGSAFLEVDALRRIGELQQDMLRVADQKSVFFLSRTNASGTSIDVQLAEQEREVVALDVKKNELARHYLLDGIALALGWTTNQIARLDDHDVPAQVLEGFDPAMQDPNTVLTNSFEVQIRSLQRELQKLNIKIAYAAFVPMPFLSLRSSDPINGTGDDGLFLSAGFNLPLWDGFKRNRNVTRQKAILRRQELDEETGRADWQLEWLDSMNRASLATAELQQSQRLETIAELKLKEAEIGFAAGSLPASGKFDSHKRYLEARVATIQKELAMQKALLDLRALSRVLCDRYIRLQELRKTGTE